MWSVSVDLIWTFSTTKFYLSFYSFRSSDYCFANFVYVLTGNKAWLICLLRKNFNLKNELFYLNTVGYTPRGTLMLAYLFVCWSLALLLTPFHSLLDLCTTHYSWINLKPPIWDLLAIIGHNVQHYFKNILSLKHN